MRNIFFMAMIIGGVSLIGCSETEEQKHEALVKKCWAKYEHDTEGLVKDPKCSNFTVVERFTRVGLNRQCGYPDLYAGERNLNDLNNLSKEDRAYTEKVLNCTDKYMQHAEPNPDPWLKGRYLESSIPKCLNELAKDQKCNIPAVKERLEKLIRYTRGDIKGDSNLCWGKADNYFF